MYNFHQLKTFCICSILQAKTKTGTRAVSPEDLPLAQDGAVVGGSLLNEELRTPHVTHLGKQEGLGLQNLGRLLCAEGAPAVGGRASFESLPEGRVQNKGHVVVPLAPVEEGEMEHRGGVGGQGLRGVRI